MLNQRGALSRRGDRRLSKRMALLGATTAAVMGFSVPLATAATADPSLSLQRDGALVVASGRNFPASSVAQVVASAEEASGTASLNVSSGGRFLIKFLPPTGFNGTVTVQASSGAARASKSITVGTGSVGPVDSGPATTSRNGLGSGIAAETTSSSVSASSRSTSASSRNLERQTGGSSSGETRRSQDSQTRESGSSTSTSSRSGSSGSGSGTVSSSSTTAASPSSGGAVRVLPVPYINQYSPKGADSGYQNGSSNCGPTSMAMIARFYNYSRGDSMTDAELVTHFNVADGKASGATDANGIKAMAAQMGKPVVHKLGADLGFVDQSIAAGKPLAARGIFSAGGVRHYIVITGKNSSGDYTVNDSASSSRKTVSASQLRTFIENHPEGAFFSIG